MSSPFPARAKARSPRRSLIARFGRNRDGATAVEFALLALPFFGIIFAILEVALYLWASQTLETMVSEAARTVYTGQFQRDNPANNQSELAGLRDKFVRAICYEKRGGREVKRAALFDCERDVKIDVASANGFPDIVSRPIDPRTNRLTTDGWGYQETRTGQIVVIRAAVEFPVYVSIYGPATLANRTRLILATAVFRNEPF